MRRILQAMILAALWGSASTLAMTNEIAQSAAEKSNDVQLQAAIEEATRTGPLTANSLIVVHVNQGEVTLEGTAKNSLAQREATRLAETVLGVKGIRNRLGVVNTQTAVVPGKVTVTPSLFQSSGTFPHAPGNQPARQPASAR